MQTIKTPQADLHVSDDILREYHFELGDEQGVKDQLIWEFLNFFDKNLLDSFKQYLDLYGKINSLSVYAMLYAYGHSNGKWVYLDEDKEKSVQRWINSVDGKYSRLVFKCCNIGKHTPKSKKSILVLPDHVVVSRVRADYRNTCFSLIVPKKGEITNYTIDYELNELRKQARRIK